MVKFHVFFLYNTFPVSSLQVVKKKTPCGLCTDCSVGLYKTFLTGGTVSLIWIIAKIVANTFTPLWSLSWSLFPCSLLGPSAPGHSPLCSHNGSWQVQHLSPDLLRLVALAVSSVTSLSCTTAFFVSSCWKICSRAQDLSPVSPLAAAHLLGLLVPQNSSVQHFIFWELYFPSVSAVPQVMSSWGKGEGVGSSSCSPILLLRRWAGSLQQFQLKAFLSLSPSPLSLQTSTEPTSWAVPLLQSWLFLLRLSHWVPVVTKRNFCGLSCHCCAAAET